MKYCPNCNNQADSSALFCTSCGGALVEESPAAPVEEVAAKTCPACNCQVDENAAFCVGCGQSLAEEKQVTTSFAQPQSQTPPPPPTYNYAPPVPSYDHTAEYDAKDISDNKVFAMLCYLSSLFGILIAVVAAQQSPYAMFHARQAMKFFVVEALMTVVTAFLFWTFIVPIVCGIAIFVFLIIKIIAVFQIGSGKAIEPAIIRSVGFLK